ncbi:hypothetical protein GGF43_003641, partial [Coemansia sp. RSA 2618]
MREILTLQIGQCGNQIGAAFWENIIQEHGISPEGIFEGKNHSQIERANVYFTEARGNRFVPRVVAIDLEPGVLESIKDSKYGKMFRPESM